jgi:hypothetical protein
MPSKRIAFLPNLTEALVRIDGERGRIETIIVTIHDGKQINVRLKIHLPTT